MITDRVGFETKTRLITNWYFFQGTGDLKKGMGLCLERGYYSSTTGEAVTDALGKRDKIVDLPDQDNAENFVGVAARDYPANANGQWIEVNEVGSTCMIALGVDATIGNFVSCSAGQGGNGRFSYAANFKGPGAAQLLQTVTAVLESQLIGADTCYLDAAGTTLTDTAATFVTNGVAAGDKVVITSGENDGTDYAVPGTYTVASVTSETVLVLTSAAASDATASGSYGTMEVNYYIISGNPMALAKLLDGPDCGLHEMLQPPSTGHASNDTFAMMTVGATYLTGAITIGTEDARETIAAGKYIGQKKYVKCLGTYGSHEAELKFPSGSFVYGIATANPGLEALSTLEFDAADEEALFEFKGDWVATFVSGADIAHS